MGMSNDFEVAIEEGATLVRLGTALFEEGADMIALADHAEGCVLPVRAQPGRARPACWASRPGRSRWR